MSALVTVRQIFSTCMHFCFTCRTCRFNIKGCTCKTAVVSANQFSFIRVWDSLQTWGVLMFLILFFLALCSSVSSNYTSIYYWVIGDRECLVIATKGNRAHLNKSPGITERYNITAISTEKAKYCHTMLEMTKEKRCVMMFCLYHTAPSHPWLCMCGWTSGARYSRLSFRCVLWYGNGVAGVGELRRSGSRHHGEHGGGTAAAQTIESHHA